MKYLWTCTKIGRREKISLWSVCYSLGVRDTKDSRHVKCFDLKIKQHLGGGATHWDTHAEEDLEFLGKQTFITKEKYRYL